MVHCRFCWGCPPKALGRAESYAHTSWTKILTHHPRALFTELREVATAASKSPAARNYCSTCSTPRWDTYVARPNPAKARVAGLLEEVMHTCTGARPAREHKALLCEIYMQSFESPFIIAILRRCMSCMHACMHACMHDACMHACMHAACNHDSC